MDSINLTPEAAEEVIKVIMKILDNGNGLELAEIEIRTGDKSGRDGKPADEVEVHAKYAPTTVIGNSG